MSGNLKPFVLQSSTAVAFTLEVGGSQVLNETYYPGNGNLIEIDLREVVESYLSFTFPSSDVFNQTLLVRSFTAKFDGQTVSFNAIRAGKARLNQSASEFLKENFLTWQPQVKPVTYYSPEWLTYYAVETCRIKLKAYFEDGTSSETTLSSPSAGTCYTLNLQYGVVSGKFSGKRPTYYDVWVESTGGQRLTYVQRYIGSPRRSEDENWYLFENSLGGLDSLRAYGSLDDSPEYEHNVSQLDGVLTEYRVDTNRKYTRNTGYLTPQESAWLQDMFSSRQKYAYTASGYYKIVFTASDGGRSSTDLPSSYSFTYQFAEDLPFLDIQRREDLPGNLELKTPEGETFFLPPRLAEFPKLSLSPDLLLPAQEPHTEKWGTITAGTLKDSVLNELIEQLQGLEMDPQPSGGLDAYLIKVGDMTVPTDDNIFSAARTLQEIQKNSLWQLVNKALDGSDLPEEQQYLTPLFGRNIVVPGDVIAFSDGGEYASGLPVADFDTFGLFKAKREGGLLFDATEGWYVNPDYAGGGGGLDIDQLQKYLNDNGYLKLSSPLTGYTKPDAYSPIAATDTILSAIGKLERNFGNYVDLTTNQTIGGVKTFNETILSKKDVIAYADGGEYASGLPVADQYTYGLVKVDGTTVRINASGQLEADAGGGIDFTVGTGLDLSVASVLSVKFGTTAGTACQGNDSRLHTHNNKSILDGITSGLISNWNTAYTNNHTHNNKTVLDGISSTKVSHWDTAYTNNHTHSNKSYLDVINQGLGTSYSPTFKAITLSEWTIDGTGGDLNLRHFSQLAAYFSGSNNGNFVTKGTMIAEGDVIAYQDGGSYASGLPVADSSTYGLVRYDGTTIGKNSSGQLYVINAGSGGGSNITVVDSLTSQSKTDALSANQGYQLDQRLKNVRWSTPDGTDYVRVYLGSEYRDLSKNGHSHAWSTITSKPSWIGSTKPSYSWSEITNKPTVISSITYSTSGSGNAVTNVTASGNTVYVTKGTISGGSSWNGGTVSNGITISTSSAVGISIQTGRPFIKFGSYWEIRSGSDLNFYYNGGSAVAYFSGSNRGNLWIAGTLSQNSDMRLKTVVSPITDALKAISTFDVFRYKYNNDKLGRVRIGMSAQQVKIYYPELVFTESDGYYSMDYVSMSAVLVGGMQELYTRFLPVENKVKILESRVQNLQLRLDNAYREIFELKQQMGGAA